MRDYIQKRVMDIANYIIDTKATVRQTAKLFNVSKSTVHKDVTERLPAFNKQMASKVKRILDQNKAERHIRGGEATVKNTGRATELRLRGLFQTNLEFFHYESFNVGWIDVYMVI